MMKFRNTLTAALTLSVFGMLHTNADAAFSLFATGGPLTKADGETPITDGTVAFYADGDNDGFGSFVSPDTFDSDDADDIFLGTAAVNNAVSDIPGTITGTFGPFTAEAGDQIGIVFYDNTFSESATGPGFGVDFGVIENIITLENPNGSSIGFNFISSEFGGNPSPAQLSATSGTTIPEPGTATAMIAALGGLTMMSRRRRSA